MKQLRIDGVIGEEVIAESFQADLDALELNDTEELHLIINSPGGSVIEGYAIYNRLISLPNKVNVKIEGLAASIATLIALAGDRIEMSEVGMFMIHRASVMAMGNKNELQKQAEVLEIIDNTLVSVYAARTGMNREEIETIFDEGDKYYDAHQAVEAGFVDEVVDKVSAEMAAKMQENNKKYMSKFMDFLNLSKETDEKEVVETTEATADVKETTNELTVESVSNSVDELRKDVSDMSEMISKLMEYMEAKDEAEAKEVEVDVEAEVSTHFATLLAKLPKTEGVVAEANGTLNEVTETWKESHPKFRSVLAGIEAKTRKN